MTVILGAVLYATLNETLFIVYLMTFYNYWIARFYSIVSLSEQIKFLTI